MFKLDSPGNRKMKNDFEQVIDEAVEMAVRHNLRAADITIKIGVSLPQTQGVDGRQLLCPRYEYKTRYTVSAGADGEKGQTDSDIGMWRDGDGYWHEQMLSQQTSLMDE